MSTEEMSTDEMSTDEMSTDEMSTEEMSTEEMSTDEMSTDEMSTEEFFACHNPPMLAVFSQWLRFFHILIRARFSAWPLARAKEFTQ